MHDNTEKLLKQIRLLVIVVIVLLVIRDTILFEIAILFALICGAVYGSLRFFEYLVERKIARSRAATEAGDGENSDGGEQ